MEEKKSRKFPEHFFWGAATSSHQIEGETRNDWSEWEKEHSKRLAGKAEREFSHLPNWDAIKTQATDPLNYISGKATDHYNRYEEDLNIVKDLHLNSFRFSLEWSRIEPQEGIFDPAAIAHYQNVINACRERNIEPFVTLWHWTIPLWLRDKGGVESKEFPACFERFTKHVLSNLHGVVYWTTLNEPTSVIGNAYMKNNWPPQRKSLLGTWRAYHRLAEAHIRAYHAIHAVQPNAKVAFANILVDYEPASRGFLDRIATWIADFLSNRYLLSLTGNTHDYFALQYYFHHRVRFPYTVVKNSHSTVSDMGWEIYPKGIYNIIKRFVSYNKPIFITENGTADAEDRIRTQFIQDHLRWVHRAIQEGALVQGYFYWSLLDNFEWDKGFWPRFGLVEVDYKTQERKIRSSAKEFSKICESNRIS